MAVEIRDTGGLRCWRRTKATAAPTHAPVHRHDVAVCELTIRGELANRRGRNDAAPVSAGTSRRGELEPLLDGEAGDDGGRPGRPQRATRVTSFPSTVNEAHA